MAEASSPLLSSHNNRNLLLLCAIGTILISVLADGGPPIVFIFGDSTFDVGTNNYIPSAAKANFYYYGIDFPYAQSTGRFSNGYNSADFIVKQLGYKQSPPPFLALLQDNSTFQTNVLKGVNFASGGAGILDGTGNQTWVKVSDFEVDDLVIRKTLSNAAHPLRAPNTRIGDVISLAQQVQQFATVQGNITGLLGQNKSAEFFAGSLFFISIGSNDIFDHHLYNETTVSEPDLMAALRSNYTAQLTALYNLGARKFGIVSVPPIGCCPYARLQNSSDCLTELNDHAQAFHSMVSDLLQNLTSQLQGMTYSLGDAYTMISILMDDPSVLGIENIDAACCGNGTLNADKPCNITQSPNLCPNRSAYLFWDSFHPTQFVAEKAAITLFRGKLRFVAPMNFNQLAGAST